MGGRGGSGGASARGKSSNNAAVSSVQIVSDSISNYGNVSTMANTSENRAKMSNGFVSSSDPSKIIVVSDVKIGVSEKQIDYAQSVKNQKMQMVNDNMRNIINNPGANKSKAINFRNKLMEKIDSETNAKTILDNLRNKDIQSLAAYYKIKP